MKYNIVQKGAPHYCIDPLIICFVIFVIDKARFNAEFQRSMYKESQPEPAPEKGTPEYDELSQFCLTVEIMLVTVLKNEFQAATCVIKPPSEKFHSSVRFPSSFSVVGKLAHHNIALIQTDGTNCIRAMQGAIDIFPGTKMVVNVGCCAAFDHHKVYPGDVLISTSITDMSIVKLDATGNLTNRGERVNTTDFLRKVFCNDLFTGDEFIVSETNRSSIIIPGSFVSTPLIIDNAEFRDKIRDISPESIGLDTVGGELLKFQRQSNLDGIILIKGVCDYADGNKTKGWQFTASLASVNYTMKKLSYYFGKTGKTFNQF